MRRGPSAAGGRILKGWVPATSLLAASRMANRSKRGRSRKRRPSSGGRASGATSAAAPADGAIAVASGEGESSTGTAKAARGRPARRGQAQPASRTPVSRRYGQRPQPPWHPLPLSELLILVGAIGVIVGFGRGISHGGPPLLAGIAAVALGTFEVTLREHRSGFRSHTVMLAALPVVVFHSVLALAISSVTRIPPIATVGMLALDLVLFLAMFRLLRSDFLTARTRAAGRR